mmetsp:Transcript_127870/g.319218  ORF Transcript_127870/g.319218 Transcript_127870/m.319218 type:complete len:89 (+) Transcript_127870:100-366(+)
MQIFVNVGGGRVISLDAEAHSTINDLKVMVERREGIPASQQSFIFSAKKMEGNRTVGDYRLDRLFRPLYMVRQPPVKARLPMGAWGGA